MDIKILYEYIPHSVKIVSIIIGFGAFGGYLNYLHNFDTNEEDRKLKKTRKTNTILLGIGAAFLVPAFLQMISSKLASNTNSIDYLIFAGFCLIAAIFSRRFITTIGDKILEKIDAAQKTANEAKKQSEYTRNELSNAKERIDDVKLAVDIQNTEEFSNNQLTQQITPHLLIDLANNYVEKTSVPNYNERIKIKSELGRKMGEIIIRNNLSKIDLFNENKSEGMLLALAYSVYLKPNIDDLDILLKISPLFNQLYTKYSILNAVITLARNSLIPSSRLPELQEIIHSFTQSADTALLRKIEETQAILDIVEQITPNEINE